MTDFERSAEGRPRFGLCIMYPAPGVIERIGPDWDWVWVDGQHGQMGYTETLALVRACDFVNRPAFVRVPGHESAAISLALDMGAAGVIVPQVHTVQQAEALVQTAKFPPLGDRSFGGRRPVDLAGRGYAKGANTRQMLILQIESLEGIENTEAIAALPGVDGLFLGPDDIHLRTHGDMLSASDPAMLSGYMKVVASACHKHDKHSVMVGASSQMLERCLQFGFSMIVGGGDAAFLAQGSKAASAAAREQAEAHLTKRVGEKAKQKSGEGSMY